MSIGETEQTAGAQQPASNQGGVKKTGRPATYHDLRDRARELLAEPLPEPGAPSPDRLLQALLAALERAAKVNEPVGMAEFGVQRARELARLQAFDPYSVLATDRATALRLAELQSAPDRTLCWLLFAWDLFIQQQAPEALGLLETAASRGVRVGGRHADHAGQMLLHLAKHGGIGVEAANRLLDEPARFELLRRLLALGQRPQAEKLAEGLTQPELRQKAREDCLRAQLDALEKKRPRHGESTLDVAGSYPPLMARSLARLRPRPDTATLSRVLGTVARRLGAAGDSCASVAWTLAQRLPVGAGAVRHLIGEGLIRVPEELPSGLRVGALIALQRWEDALQAAEDAATVGAMLYRLGRLEDARGHWDRAQVDEALWTSMLAAGALEEAAQVARRVEQWRWLAQAAGRARQVEWFQDALRAPDADVIAAGSPASFPLALGAVAELGNSHEKARALYGIAAQQAAEDPEGARTTIGLAMRAAPRATLSLGARADLMETSPVLLRTVVDQVFQLPAGDERDNALAQLAAVQAGSGNVDELHTTIAYLSDPTYPRLHPAWRRLADSGNWEACRTLVVPFASSLCGAWEILGDLVTANPREAGAIAARVPTLLAGLEALVLA